MFREGIFSDYPGIRFIFLLNLVLETAVLVKTSHWPFTPRHLLRLPWVFSLLLLLDGRRVDGNERLVDVRDDSAAGDGGLDERVELLVPADGEVQVAGRDALQVHVLGRVARQLQDLEQRENDQQCRS